MPFLTTTQIAFGLSAIRHYVIPTGEKNAIPIYYEAELLELLKKWGLGEPDLKVLAKDLEDY